MSVTGFNRRRRMLADKNTKEPTLESMTKAQLLLLASTKGIEGLDERMLKADIIAVIEAVK